MLLNLSHATFAQDNQDPFTELAEIEAGLELLETRFDRNHPALVEMLEQLADRYSALGRFDLAHQALDRAVQITRVAEGLFTPGQLPLLQKKLTNFANRGDWVGAQSQFEHLLWLYQEKTPISGELVQQLMQLADLHLRGVVEDAPLQQSFHFRQAMEINRMALLAASHVWGEHSPQSIPIMYRKIQQHYLHTVAIDQGGETGYALRELVPGSRWVYDKETMRRAHFYTGRDMLYDIRNILSDTDPVNAQAIAMVDLYLADWHVLYTHRNEAIAQYAQAYTGLVHAGVAESLLDQFFKEPVLLPVESLYLSVEEALATRSTLYFSEWSESFPNVRAPWALGSAGESEGQFAEFAINITGLNEVSRWVNGSLRTGIGVVDAAELKELSFSSSIPEERWIGKLHLLRFRPRLLEGSPVAASSTLKYMLANGR